MPLVHAASMGRIVRIASKTMSAILKSFEITIDGTTYRAENVRVVSGADNHRRLIVSLVRYFDTNNVPEYSDEALLIRIRAFKDAFERKFPDAPKFSGSTRVFAGFSEWPYWITGIQEKHIEWAKAAKESGLIDSYIVDYVPDGSSE
jgi:hypothetical protein